MSFYFVQGVLGGGKSLMTVAQLKRYIKRGNRIATNMNLDLKELCGSAHSKQYYTRLPDVPTSIDLEILGPAYEGKYDEKKFGALVLDECALWLNSRDWSEKDRKKLIAWFVQARKFRWDVYLLVQDVDMVDAQIRKALCEYIVTCHNIQKVKIPIFSRLYCLLTGKDELPLPKMHLGPVVMGRSQNNILVDRWAVIGTDLYKAYETDQTFDFEYANGVHSVLSPWHMTGRYLPSPISGKSLLWRIPFWLFLQGVKLIAGRRFIVSPSGSIQERCGHA